MKSFFIAFAMYSKIPVPNTKWDERGMRYALCFFPIVGAVIGVCFYAAFRAAEFLAFGSLLRGALLTAVPILITGGIHADGFIDTTDAISSYAGREKRLEILKDPHVGAFGIIYTVIYFIIYFGFASELGARGLIVVCLGFVISRSLSGIGAVSIVGAREKGMLSIFADGADRKAVIMASALFLSFSIAAAVICNMAIGIVMAAASVGTYLYYKRFSIKNFGGITGDLAGYFLQLCEIAVLISVVIVEKLVV